MRRAAGGQPLPGRYKTAGTAQVAAAECAVEGRIPSRSQLLESPTPFDP